MVIDILKGILTLFYNPLFYLLLIGLVLFGYQRVRRERVSFGVKVYGVFNNIFASIAPSLIMGLIGTVALLIMGVSLPSGVIVLMVICHLLVMLTLRLRYLSPAIILGMTMIISDLLPHFDTGVSLINSWLNDIYHVSYLSFSLFFLVSLFIESFLVLFWGHKQTSPRIINSKRGKKVGAHEASYLWIVPLFFLMPTTGGLNHHGWWPLSPGANFGFVLFPLGIGLQQLITYSLPKRAVKETGIWLLLISVLTAVIAGAGLLWDMKAFIIVAAAFAMISRLILVFVHQYQLEKRPFFFSTKSDGLMIIGVIPHSPADRMNLREGEIIKKVNDQDVLTEKDFYQALQSNMAYCKVEVVDVSGEPRFERGSIHEGDYHTIGLLFLELDRRKPYLKARSQ
ncbi:PDZ domain-containing protein [Scopulibacillus cellulosilyticus]|uniref:PDZ domain-containing protein n=1 Tax=Scopulibacillus cellulosilyticus TaxID=2665665 RepID=A0ABW2PWW9_9BACL